MCEKRKYRFLKVTEEHPEFKGVLPTVVQSLLDARKETRKEMGKLKDSLKTITNEHEYKEVQTTIDILNQRQLAYKISANSMYGITGVKAGMLPFMPVAMSVTYMGRKNINVAAETLQSKYGGTLVYGDTDCLVKDSPILIKNNITDEIFYTTVDKLSQGDWKPINPNKEISTPKEGYTIWSDRGFTKIENVVRCKPLETMTRVTTHIGTVVCSDNHSLLSETLNCVTPQEVEIGDKLCVTGLPLPEDTPDEPLYPNKLTSEDIEDYCITADFAGLRSSGLCPESIPQFQYKNITSKIAFIWGLFMADGSKCDNNMVQNYRDLFYHDKYKKIPDIILQAPIEIRQAFFMGFYAGDGSKKDPSISISFKGQIGSAQLFYLMKSVGYQVSINVRDDKPNIYKLTGSTPTKALRKVPNAIKKKALYRYDGDYIYDIQTGNHHFAAGIGQLVVHNSSYVSFHDKKFTIPELWDYAIKVADEISGLFPPPMKLEFEEAVYKKFLILTKKRYMYQSSSRDGKINPEIGKRGVVLNRRDNSAFIRKTYENVVKIIFENTESIEILKQKVVSSLTGDINSMFNHTLPIEDFIITKATGDYGNLQAQYFLNEKGLHRATLGQYNVPFLTDDIREQEGIETPQEETDWYLSKLPAHIQLLEKIKRRGQMRNEGSRLEYVIVETNDLKAKQSAKIETSNYYCKNKGLLNLDYLYYLHRLINPIDQILEVIFDLKDFMKTHYNHRVAKQKLTIQLNDLFSPKLEIQKDTLYLVKICPFEELIFQTAVSVRGKELDKVVLSIIDMMKSNHVNDRYYLIYGNKKDCKETLKNMEELCYVEYKLEMDYVSKGDMYSFIRSKYGPNTALKTQFIFKDNYIELGDMTESKLVSAIKRACLK
jgi:hypothetical protein